jgi:hypothetical protein
MIALTAGLIPLRCLMSASRRGRPEPSASAVLGQPNSDKLNIFSCVRRAAHKRIVILNDYHRLRFLSRLSIVPRGSSSTQLVTSVRIARAISDAV